MQHVFGLRKGFHSTHLSAKVGGTPLGQLKDYGGLLVTGCFQSGDDRRGGGDIDGGNGECLLLSVFEEAVDIVAVDDACLALEDVLTTHCRE